MFCRTTSALAVLCLCSVGSAQILSTWAVNVSAPSVGTLGFTHESPNQEILTSLTDQVGTNPWNQAASLRKYPNGPRLRGSSQVSTTNYDGAGRQNSQVSVSATYFERLSVSGKATFNPFGSVTGTRNAETIAGGMRASVSGTVTFRIYRRSASNRTLIANQSRFLQINEVGTLTEGDTLAPILLENNTYEVEFSLSAVALARRSGGLGLAEASQDYDAGFYFSDIEGTVSTQRGYLSGNPVPEPFTITGLGVAALGFVRRVRRRR